MAINLDRIIQLPNCTYIWWYVGFFFLKIEKLIVKLEHVLTTIRRRGLSSNFVTLSAFFLYIQELNDWPEAILEFKMGQTFNRTMGGYV